MKHLKTILITGGAGFVGSSLAMNFRRDQPNVRVIALDNLTRRGSELNLPRLKAAGVEFLHGDVRVPDDLESAGPFELLIDCAAEPSVQAGMKGSPRPVFDINLNGTINCLEAARKNDAAFLFLSTSRVYPIQLINQVPWVESATRFEWCPSASTKGVTSSGITEDFPLAGARSYYGASKLASELIAQEYAASANMPVLINRCGVLTGPWQMGKVDQGVVALWVLRHHFQQPLKYTGYDGVGKQVRDVLHVDDLYRPDTGDGRIDNVGGSRNVSVSLLELTAICQRVTGITIPISQVSETSDVDLRLYLTDTTRVQADFDWCPRCCVEQIVEDIYTWVLENESQLALVMGFDRKDAASRSTSSASLAGGMPV